MHLMKGGERFGNHLFSQRKNSTIIAMQDEGTGRFHGRGEKEGHRAGCRKEGKLITTITFLEGKEGTLFWSKRLSKKTGLSNRPYWRSTPFK